MLTQVFPKLQQITLVIVLASFTGVFFFYFPPSGFAETVAERNLQKTKIDQGIKKYRINIRRLQQGIKRQQEQIKRSHRQERDLLAELQDIDTRLFEQQEKLDVLEARMKAQGKLIVVKIRELDRAKREKQAVQDHLQKRIKAYYKMGNIGFINVTFSTQTLPELLKFHDSFQSLIKYDKNVIATYRHTIGELGMSVETLELEEALLEEFISQTVDEKSNIGLIRQEKETLLIRIRTQTKLHKQAIAEMEKAASTFTSSLQILEKKEDLFDQGFLRNKGQLLPPVEGLLITRFHEKTTNRLGMTTTSKGIAIKAPNGSIVRPVFEGTVMFSGYLRGYGNTIIVNHGYRYYSIYSRVERLLAKRAQKVDEHSDLGIMGDTATLMSEGMYFEIRQDSKTLDPLLWLDKSKLTFSE